jgi:hypothetical protein
MSAGSRDNAEVSPPRYTLRELVHRGRLPQPYYHKMVWDAKQHLHTVFINDLIPQDCEITRP